MRLEEILPGYVFEQDNDLLSGIKNLDEEESVLLVKQIKKEYAFSDANSSDICLEAIKARISFLKR